MTLDEIKAAVDAGHTVCWKNHNYEVVEWTNGLHILCISNQHAIGLTWLDGVTMNGAPEDFFIRTTPKGPCE